MVKPKSSKKRKTHEQTLNSRVIAWIVDGQCMVLHNKWDIRNIAKMQIFILCNNLGLLIYGLLFVTHCRAGRIFGKLYLTKNFPQIEFFFITFHLLHWHRYKWASTAICQEYSIFFFSNASWPTREKLHADIINYIRNFPFLARTTLNTKNWLWT